MSLSSPLLYSANVPVSLFLFPSFQNLTGPFPPPPPNPSTPPPPCRPIIFPPPPPPPSSHSSASYPLYLSSPSPPPAAHHLSPSPTFISLKAPFFHSFLWLINLSPSFLDPFPPPSPSTNKHSLSPLAIRPPHPSGTAPLLFLPQPPSPLPLSQPRNSSYLPLD